MVFLLLKGLLGDQNDRKRVFLTHDSKFTLTDAGLSNELIRTIGGKV